VHTLISHLTQSLQTLAKKECVESSGRKSAEKLSIHNKSRVLKTKTIAKYFLSTKVTSLTKISKIISN
jgi:hypothetical protein